MDAAQRQEIKDFILDQIMQIREEIRSLREQTRPIPPDNAIGRLSRMEAINDKGVAETKLRTTLARLARLEQALRRTGEDDFGLCGECGEAIPAARLKLLPEIGLCVGCLEERQG